MEQRLEPLLDRWPHQAPLVRGEDDPLEPHLAASLSVATEACIAVAFILDRGLDLIRPYLVEFLERGGRLRILTGDYFGVTEPDGLRRLLDLEGDFSVEARVFETQGQAFHPKAYLFRVGPSEGIAYIGSSNLSRSALRDGVEWNYRVVRSSNDGGFEKAWTEFERLFAHPKTRPLTHDWIQAYASKRRPQDHQVEIGVQEEPLETPRPRPTQIEALQALEDTRKDGAEAGLVVLATGLGKTWLSAFDVLAFAGERGKALQDLRVLFVAHREEILSQALDTYRRLAPQASLGKYTGTEKVIDAQILFASVQTLARVAHLRRFQRDEFDYIIVDEFHHAAAATYRKVIDYFHPGFLLGLTATPERTDGGDLLALCGQNLVYRCDLGRGVRGGELSPFQYYGVPDSDVDYSAVPWRSGRFVDTEGQLTDALTTNRRAQNALDEWRKRSGQRGIGFCCSVAHADFMAQFFRDQSVRAVAVHSKKTSAPRTISLQQLDEGKLEIVFCVDMFNEGVDVPNIDTILMLRPTESRIIWLQQFGRGLRFVKGKVLQVVDYIGNHKAFLSKVQSLLPAFFDEIGDSPASLRKALRALREGRLELPPDCGITYELEAIEILEQLLRPTARSSELQAAYETFRDQHGARPTARELALQGTLTRASIKPFGSWFELVRDQGDLTYEEQAQLEQDQGLLATIEQSRMERSYKMLILLAMMEEGVFPGSIDVDRLAGRFQAIASRTPILRDELRETLGAKSGSLSSMLKGNPLRAWAGTKRGGGSAFFSLEDDEFSAAPAHAASVADGAASTALTDMCRELAEWRLSDYIDRHTPKRVECPVFTDPSGARSIPLDRSLYGGLPEGLVRVQVDGESRFARFERSALTTVYKASNAESEDLLPQLLTRWFGAPSPSAPEDCSAIIDLTQDPIRLQPGAGHRARGAEVGAKYMRAEIPPLFGIEFIASKWNQGMVTVGSGMVLLVTLNKSGKLDAHQYDDKFLSPIEFQWQSQNQTRREGKHGRILTGEDDPNRQIHLFVRKEGKTRAQKAAPFIYCGQLQFVRWEGEEPITVWWKLTSPLDPATRSKLEVGG
ncbi:DUF3427 domain-containing protein [bacterium]|nr:DUF3427 domain-containing protein [bacterium]